MLIHSWCVRVTFNCNIYIVVYYESRKQLELKHFHHFFFSGFVLDVMAKDIV